MRDLRAVLATGLVWTALFGWGCAFGEIHWSDPLKRSVALTTMQRQYTQLVRWGEFAKASAFVEADAREQFLQSASESRDLRFTDFETGSVDIDDETGDATVEVTYLAYRTSSPIEIRIREIQHWSRSGIGNDWQVEPEFVGLDSASSATPRH